MWRHGLMETVSSRSDMTSICIQPITKISGHGKTWTNTTVLKACQHLPCSLLGWHLESKSVFLILKRSSQIFDFQGRKYLRQCVMLSSYGQCFLSRSKLAMAFLPALNYTATLKFIWLYSAEFIFDWGIRQFLWDWNFIVTSIELYIC